MARHLPKHKMKDKIHEFLKNHKKKILLLEHKGYANVLFDWNEIRGAVGVAKNVIITRTSKIFPLKAKPFIFRHLLGMKIGNNVGVSAEADFDPFYPGLITIDEGAMIGWKVNILCHEFTKHHIRLGRVHIGKNVLVGAFSSIRSGVKIGDNSIIAMDSLVNKNIPPNEMWGGVPARRIRKLRKKRK